MRYRNMLQRFLCEVVHKSTFCKIVWFIFVPLEQCFSTFFIATQMLSGNREQQFGDPFETCNPNSGPQEVQKLTFKLESVSDLLKKVFPFNLFRFLDFRQTIIESQQK